ncbi:unnamed protein product [Nezara viridula]|uniref:NADH dehydrogenase [ubiquinone] 1 beta subcomplex subunit 9 n=1 Tax=Nezara viridula TaxID=85310 RepID=A0A9P0MSM9_NEZVI|nr:unnamed protein product [Nezara viridula]
MKAVTIPFELPLTHKQRVLKLYKEILRNLESWYYYRPVFRYQATIMRAKFDQNKSVAQEKAAQLVCLAEQELHKKSHYEIKQFPHTIRGIAYMRDVHIPDWVLDYWHPLEKAQNEQICKKAKCCELPNFTLLSAAVPPIKSLMKRFPEYFCKREKRKEEYIKMWEKKYGPSSPEKCH